MSTPRSFLSDLFALNKRIQYFMSNQLHLAVKNTATHDSNGWNRIHKIYKIEVDESIYEISSGKCFK